MDRDCAWIASPPGRLRTADARGRTFRIDDRLLTEPFVCGGPLGPGAGRAKPTGRERQSAEAWRETPTGPSRSCNANVTNSILIGGCEACAVGPSEESPAGRSRNGDTGQSLSRRQENAG